VVLDGTKVLTARVAAGGVGTKPWRLPHVEKALEGHALNAGTARAAAARSADNAIGHGANDFKLKLLPRVVEQAVLTAGGQA
jgi:xanthine dehydrogenase YagS FAD-binding subunit